MNEHHPTFQDPDLLPVEGVSLHLFAKISRELSAFRHDTDEAARLAELHGVRSADWVQAAATWSRRLRENTSVAEEFRQAFRGSEG